MRNPIRIRGRDSGTMMLIFGLGLSCLLLATRLPAQVTCSTCPVNAVTCAAGPGFSVSRTNGASVNPDPSDPVGACEQIVIKTDLAYRPDVGGLVGAGYYGGLARVLAFPGSEASGSAESTNDVTPVDLATTKIGPAPCGNTQNKAMNDLLYTPTPADIAAGAVTFRFVYSDGTALLSPCTFSVSSIIEFNVFIADSPACAIAPLTSNVLAGSSASFTASGSGPAAGQVGGLPGGGWTFTWTGPNGFAQTNTGALSSTITIGNATTANAGNYNVTITDRFGCKANTSATLAVSETFWLSIAKTTNVVLTVIGPEGKTCQIESAPTPNVPSNWAIRTNFTLGAGLTTWIDGLPLPTQSYYRAAILP